MLLICRGTYKFCDERSRVNSQISFLEKMVTEIRHWDESFLQSSWQNNGRSMLPIGSGWRTRPELPGSAFLRY